MLSTKVIIVGEPLTDTRLNPKTSPLFTTVFHPVSVDEDDVALPDKLGRADAVIVFATLGKFAFSFQMSTTQLQAAFETILQDTIVPP